MFWISLVSLSLSEPSVLKRRRMKKQTDYATDQQLIRLAMQETRETPLLEGYSKALQDRLAFLNRDMSI